MRGLKQRGLDHRCQFRHRLTSSKLSGFAEKDLALAIELIACSKELMAAIKRWHTLAIKHGNELEADVPGLMSLDRNIESQPGTVK